jgi:hypothetical protein
MESSGRLRSETYDEEGHGSAVKEFDADTAGGEEENREEQRIPMTQRSSGRQRSGGASGSAAAGSMYKQLERSTGGRRTRRVRERETRARWRSSSGR